MDQRIAWPQPEQLGPSCEQWSRIWETFHINESANSNSNGNYLSSKVVSNGTQVHNSTNSNANAYECQAEKQASTAPSSSLAKQSVSATISNGNREQTAAVSSHHEATTNDHETMKRTVQQVRSERNSANAVPLDSAENIPMLSSNLCTPWARRSGYNSSVPIIGLHEEIVDFYNYVTPTEEERFMRKQVATRITQLITTVWPGSRVEIFGSFKTGLYLPTSDIDMVVIGVMNDKPPLRDLERVILERRIAEPHNVKVLDNASVPIVRVTDRETDVRVDISFSSSDSPSCVRSAELIRGYIQRYEPLRFLVLVLKQFLLERGLNETWTGGVGSYSLILMVVHFLQNHERGEATKNYGTLLVEFFETFGERFNYQQLVLRVVSDAEVDASGSARAYLKKDEFTRAVQREEPSYCPSMLTIEDPLEPLRDIARGSYCALYARKAFQHALHALREPMLGLAHSLLIRNRSGNVPNYLGRIVRISRAVNDYREQIRRKYSPLLQAVVQDSLDTARVNATKSNVKVNVTGPQLAVPFPPWPVVVPQPSTLPPQPPPAVRNLDVGSHLPQYAHALNGLAHNGAKHRGKIQHAPSPPSSSPSTDLDRTDDNEPCASHDSEEDESAPVSACSSDEPRHLPVHDLRQSFAANFHPRFQRSHRSAPVYPVPNNGRNDLAPRHRLAHRNVHCFPRPQQSHDERNVSLVRKTRSALLESRPSANHPHQHQHQLPYVAHATVHPASHGHKRKRSGEQHLSLHSVS